MRRVVRDERGFTLIELLIVVVIIGVLAAIAVPVYVGQQNEAKDTAAQSALRTAATAQQLSYARTGEYATAPDGLTAYGFRQGGQPVSFGPDSTKSSYCMEAPGGGEKKFHIRENSGTPKENGC